MHSIRTNKSVYVLSLHLDGPGDGRKWKGEVFFFIEVVSVCLRITVSTVRKLTVSRGRSPLLALFFPRHREDGAVVAHPALCE